MVTTFTYRLIILCMIVSFQAVHTFVVGYVDSKSEKDFPISTYLFPTEFP